MHAESRNPENDRGPDPSATVKPVALPESTNNEKVLRACGRRPLPNVDILWEATA